ncbi:unnamed protein product, partial [marine sediment metagenome]
AFKIIEKGKEKGIIFRLLGSIAVKNHSPKYRYLYDEMKRPLTDIFERSPFRASKTVTQIIAALAIIGNLIALWVFATNEHAWNLLKIDSLRAAMPFLFTIFLIALGLGIYLYYSNKAKSTGVELTTIFTEIPPD